MNLLTLEQNESMRELVAKPINKLITEQTKNSINKKKYKKLENY